MLAIEVRFLTGRYVATAYNDRAAAEWPPHPARLFSALVATHAEGGSNEEERKVLLRLEQLPPPSISASDADEREVATVFVPVNDLTVTGLGDEHEQALVTARKALEEAHSGTDSRAVSRAQRALASLEEKTSEFYARALAAPVRPGKEELQRAPSLLPDARSKQPRTFPSVRPHDPVVTFVWADARLEPDEELRLDALLGRVVRLGHSSSLVSLRLRDEAPSVTWVPDPRGVERMRVTKQGQLARLDAAFEQHRESEPRVLPASFETYARHRIETRVTTATSVFDDDWLILRRAGGPRLPMIGAVGIASSVRAALMKFAVQPAPEILSGHAAPNVPSQRPHLAVVPLPWVGHPHADGTVLGVALVLPRDVNAEERRAVYRAVAAWERAQPGGGELRTIPVHLGGAGVLELERLELASEVATLRAATWSRPASIWASVTPVALDRHPGDLNDPNPERRERAWNEAEADLLRACSHVGLPKPLRCEVLPFAPVAGARKAKHYPPFPARTDRARRQLVHARLEFEEQVRGPLLLGAGRYLGLGLFRPVTHE